MIAADHNKIKVFNIIMVLALAFSLVAAAIGVVAVVKPASALNDIPPVAEAGPDQAVQQNLSYASNGLITLGPYPAVTLDGSMSYDPDGTIASYAWTPYLALPNGDYSTANGWPALTSGATINSPSSAVTTVNFTSPGLYVFMLTVTDNGGISASNLVVVVAGKTWFVSIFQGSPPNQSWDVGSNSYDGTLPYFPSSGNPGTIGPWLTITHAIQSPTVMHGDRIMVSPNGQKGSQLTPPKFNTGGFGSSGPEKIVVDKWLTIWSAYGRDDILDSSNQELNPPEYATTINVSAQEGTPDAVNQVVKIIWPHGITDLSKTDQLNAERTGVIFGGDGHGFNLIGAPIGILAGATVPAAWVNNTAYSLGDIVSPRVDNGFNYKCTTAGTSALLLTGEPVWPTTVGATVADGTGTLVWTCLGERGGADAVDIYQNRIEEPNPITGNPNYTGIEVDGSKAPTVQDNIVLFDFNDVAGSLVGIILSDCDETLPNVVYYLDEGNVPTPNIKGGAQVIWNFVDLHDENIVNGIMLGDCPKAWVYKNTVNTEVKKSQDAASIGIGLYAIDPEDGCPFSVVDRNIVNVSVDGFEAAWALGISVVDSKSVTVSNNTIEVFGQGETPLTLGGLLGVGIYMESDPFSVVIGNTVDVDNTATVAVDAVVPETLGVNALGGDQLGDIQGAFDNIANGKAPKVDLAGSLAIGIFAHESPDIHIGGPPNSSNLGNKIDVDSQVALKIANLQEIHEGGGAALAQGITVLESAGALVAYNHLTGPNDPNGAKDSQDKTNDIVGVHADLVFNVPQVTSPPNQAPSTLEGIGKCGANGILVSECGTDQANNPAKVIANVMEVLADGNVILSALQEVATMTDGWSSSVVGQLDKAVEDMASNAADVASSNQVNITHLQVGDLTFNPDAFAKGKIFVFSIGVATLNSLAAVIAGNMVNLADANLIGQVIAETIPVSGLSDAVVANSDSAMTLAIGILDYHCSFVMFPTVIVPTTVMQNLVTQAIANSSVSVEAAQIVASDSGGSAEAHGSGLAVGMGIVVIGGDDLGQAASLTAEPSTLPSDATITNNSVYGQGISSVDIHGYNLVSEKLASADGESVGIGAGITVIGQFFPLIDHNGDLLGIGPWSESAPPAAASFVTGIGDAYGTTDARGLSAEDPHAEVDSIGIGVGIAAVFCLDPQITYNCNFHKNVYGPAPSSPPQPPNGSQTTPYNPWPTPFVTGNGYASGAADAIDNAILVGTESSRAEGTTLAAGIGIMLGGDEGAFVTHNHAKGGQIVGDVIQVFQPLWNSGSGPDTAEYIPQTLTGTTLPDGTLAAVQLHNGDTPVDAVVNVYALEQDPLQRASSRAFALSLANGILIGDVQTEFTQSVYWHIPFCVKESNTFDSGATVSITSVAQNPDPCAIAVAIDAFIVFDNAKFTSLQNVDIQPVVFNYNDFPGLLLSSSSGAGASSVDLGMLIVNLTNPIYVPFGTTIVLVDARYNYWGNPLIPTNYLDPSTFNLTGPGGVDPAGLGQPLYVVADWFTAFVEWQPWLTINHEWSLDSHIGKFGKVIELEKCWNTFSVPIALDDVTIGSTPYNTWAGFKLLNTPSFTSAIGPAVWWDPTANAGAGAWVNLLPTDVLVPLKGYKVYVTHDTEALILASTAETMPTLPVYKGWNLVGPNPPFCDPGIWVQDFVSSLVRTSGSDGFTQVISQGSSQTNWSFTLGDWVQDEGNQFMKIGKAYWVYMNGNQTLAGFGFTRLPLYPESFYH